MGMHVLILSTSTAAYMQFPTQPQHLSAVVSSGLSVMSLQPGGWLKQYDW